VRLGARGIIIARRQTAARHIAAVSQACLFSSALKRFCRKCGSKMAERQCFFALLLFYGSPEDTNSSV